VANQLYARLCRVFRAQPLCRLRRGGRLRYSDASVLEAGLKQVEAKLGATLQELDRIAVIPFNRMAEWGADGRIKPEAPVHSPFIRRKQRLQLE
jgi:NAD(P)H dehydrogenase (quinone)